MKPVKPSPVATQRGPAAATGSIAPNGVSASGRVPTSTAARNLQAKMDQTSVVLSSAQLQNQLLQSQHLTTASLLKVPPVTRKPESLSSVAIIDPALSLAVQLDTSVSPRVSHGQSARGQVGDFKAGESEGASVAAASTSSVTTQATPVLSKLLGPDSHSSPRVALHAKQVSAKVIRRLIETQSQAPPAQLPPLTQTQPTITTSEPSSTREASVLDIADQFDAMMEHARNHEADQAHASLAPSPSVVDLTASTKSLIAANDNSLRALSEALRNSPLKRNPSATTLHTSLLSTLSSGPSGDEPTSANAPTQIDTNRGDSIPPRDSEAALDDVKTSNKDESGELHLSSTAGGVERAISKASANSEQTANIPKSLTPFEALAADARDAAEAWLESRLRHGRWVQSLHLAQSLVDARNTDEQIIAAADAWQDHHTQYMRSPIVQSQLQSSSSAHHLPLSESNSLRSMHTKSQLHLLIPGPTPVRGTTHTGQLLLSSSKPNLTKLAAEFKQTMTTQLHPLPSGAMALKMLGIDKQSLLRIGLSHEQVDRVYRGLWVYSVGVHDLLKRISYEVTGGGKRGAPAGSRSQSNLTADTASPTASTNHTLVHSQSAGSLGQSLPGNPQSSSDVLMEALWKVHAVLFELLNPDTYPMALVAVERASLNALHALTTRFHAFAHSRQRRVELLKKDVAQLEETQNAMRQTINELRGEKQNLIDEVVKLGKETVAAALEAAECKQELWRVRHDFTRASERYVAAEEALAASAQKYNKQLMEAKKLNDELKAELEKRDSQAKQEKQDALVQQAYCRQLESEVTSLRLQVEQYNAERMDALKLKENESARVRTLESHLQVRAREVEELIAVQTKLRRELEEEIRQKERLRTELTTSREKLLSANVEKEKLLGNLAVKEAETESLAKRCTRLKEQLAAYESMLKRAHEALAESQRAATRGSDSFSELPMDDSKTPAVQSTLDELSKTLESGEQFRHDDEDEIAALNRSTLQLQEEARIRAATAEADYRREQMETFARMTAELESQPEVPLQSPLAPEDIPQSQAVSPTAAPVSPASRRGSLQQSLGTTETVAAKEINTALASQQSRIWTQLQETRHSLQRALAQLAELTTTHARTVESLEREQADHRQTHADLAKIAAELQNVNRLRSNDAAELSKLKREKADLERTIEGLRSDLAQAKEDFNAASEANKKQVESLQEEINALTLARAETQSQSSQATAEIAALRQKNWDLSQTLQQVRAEVDRLNQLLAQSRSEVHKLTEESAVDKHALAGLRRALAEKMDELDSMEQQAAELQEKLREATQATAQRDALQKELESVREQFAEQLANELAMVERKYEAMLRELKDKYSKLAEEKQSATEELQGKLQVQVHVSSSAMETKLRAMEAEHKEMVAALQAKLDAQRDEYTATIEALQKSLDQAHALIDSLQGQEPQETEL